MAVVLVHGNDSAARANVGLLRQRIQESVSLQTGQPWVGSLGIEEVEVRSQGRVLLTKLRGERVANNWLNFVFMSDPLLLHQ